MKFISDENVAKSVVHALRNAGFDIKDIKEENLHSLPDKDIMQIAFNEDRIIITHDKDFQSTAAKHKGVILLRFKDQRPENVIKLLLPIIKSNLKNKLANNITVISESTVTIHQK